MLTVHPVTQGQQSEKQETGRLRLIAVIVICILPIPRGKKIVSFISSKFYLYWSKPSLVTLNFSKL